MNESPQNLPHSRDTEALDDWELVTFPDAMPVDNLPEDTEDLPLPPNLVSGDSYLKVHTQNQELRSQVAELEAALLRSQTSLRTEIERWEAVTLEQSESSESSDRLLTQQNQALSASQVRLGQLFVELENSHRMAQRQQILVETLTDQLQSSQEQIAQLERECAAVQQRSNEHLQQFNQSEQTVRDLRSRLHRQQRYTLQFKAALEKCLDVPPATAQEFVADFLDETPEPVVVSPPKVAIPRSQPVQPWSVTPKILEVDAPQILQPWGNAIESNIAETVESPIVIPSPIEPISDDDRLDLNQIERNPTLDETQRKNDWSQVIAQVTSIMGEEVTLIETTHLENQEIPTTPIAPLISKTKSQKRDSTTSIDLPSFPRLDAK